MRQTMNFGLGIKVLKQQKAFTYLELLIVITIIAILASTIIPNFIGFDAEARVTATKSNLESIRTRITLFRAKEGHYPQSLDDLVHTEYYDVGVHKPFLNKIPPEMISDGKGNSSFVNQISEDPLNGDGGWVYLTDTADLKVNITGKLGKKWGEYADQEPAEW